MPQPKTSISARQIKQDPPTLREVLRAVGAADELEPSHDVRDSVIRRYKVSGGSMDIWNNRNFERMADAITRSEDEIELRTDCKNRQLARLTLAKLRRRLEEE